jgi:hypothetical protein
MSKRTCAAFLVCLALTPAGGLAQIYRWTDGQGRVQFSNQPPPPGVQATIVDAEARPVPDTSPREGPDCHTLACQGRRLEQRERERQAEERRLAAERAARASREPRPRGLAFDKYISIQRGMSEGELLGIAGPPDLVSDQGIALAAPATVQSAPGVRTPARAGLALKTWTYLPTPADPFTTTITLVGGRVSELERVRRF